MLGYLVLYYMAISLLLLLLLLVFMFSFESAINADDLPGLDEMELCESLGAAVLESAVARLYYGCQALAVR